MVHAFKLDITFLPIIKIITKVMFRFFFVIKWFSDAASSKSLFNMQKLFKRLSSEVTQKSYQSYILVLHCLHTS